MPDPVVPPIVINSVGPRVLLLTLDRCELPNLFETILANGRSVGRQAQMTPQALSTTHQVQGVASVTSFMSVVYIMVIVGDDKGSYMLCRFGQTP